MAMRDDAVIRGDRMLLFHLTQIFSTSPILLVVFDVVGRSERSPSSTTAIT